MSDEREERRRHDWLKVGAAFVIPTLMLAYTMGVVVQRVSYTETNVAQQDRELKELRELLQRNAAQRQESLSAIHLSIRQIELAINSIDQRTSRQDQLFETIWPRLRNAQSDIQRVWSHTKTPGQPLSGTEAK